MKRIAVLGVSGSIGRQALEVCAWQPDQLRPLALTAGQDWQALAEAARRFRPAYIAISNQAVYPALKAACADLPLRIGVGPEGVAEAAAYQEVDLALLAISGMAALPALLAAIEAGKDIALANKEALVAAGQLVMGEIRRRGLRLYPVDSEHSAIWQCLAGEKAEDVERLILTASGGAFRDLPLAEMGAITPAMALQHPNWRMGPKITVDCATMVNKGLEIIEAHWLFGMAYERIEVLLHPESLIHSLVGFRDGSIKAQLGPADMRLPIQYALLGQERPPTPLPRLDLATAGSLRFSQPDPSRYPALGLARQAGERGGTAPAYFNGANEALVAAFLAGRLPFLSIAACLGQLLAAYQPKPLADLDQVFAAAEQGRLDAAAFAEQQPA